VSLVSDALKKARQEAARQDAAQRGLPYAVGAVEKPKSPALLVGVIAGSLAGVVLLGVIAYVAGWIGPAKSEQPLLAVAEESLEPAAVPAPSEPAPAPQPAPAQSPAIAEATPRPEPFRSPAPAAPAPVASAAPTAPATVTEPPPVAAEPAPQPAPEVEAAEPKRYVGFVPLPDGGAVTLNGIAYSEQNPIAVLDGRVVGPGESVQGFVVVAIERRQVKLEGHGQVVYLALR
jgi:hypothetical protein